MIDKKPAVTSLHGQCPHCGTEIFVEKQAKECNGRSAVVYYFVIKSAGCPACDYLRRIVELDPIKVADAWNKLHDVREEDVPLPCPICKRRAFVEEVGKLRYTVQPTYADDSRVVGIGCYQCNFWISDLPYKEALVAWNTRGEGQTEGRENIEDETGVVSDKQ